MVCDVCRIPSLALIIRECTQARDKGRGQGRVRGPPPKPPSGWGENAHGGVQNCACKNIVHMEETAEVKNTWVLGPVGSRANLGQGPKKNICWGEGCHQAGRHFPCRVVISKASFLIEMGCFPDPRTAL